MQPSADAFFRFSTDAVPERDRVSFLQDYFGKSIVKLHLQPLDRERFRQTCTLMALPGLNLATGETNGIVANRTRTLVADGNDDLIFTTNLSGRSAISQRHREITLNANEAALLSSAEVGSLGYADIGKYLSLSIPRRAFFGRVGSVEDVLMRPITADNGALRLLVDYIALTISKHASMVANVQSAFVTHVHDLVGLAVGATRDGAVLADRRGLRAARLVTMKADILAHLREEGLSVHDIARRHGVTPRYVQLLFDDTGQTFSEFVVEQRLAKAHRMLGDPAFAAWNISAVAFEVGFGNLSWFNRTFRRRFGVSPSDVRAAARHRT